MTARTTKQPGTRTLGVPAEGSSEARHHFWLGAALFWATLCGASLVLHAGLPGGLLRSDRVGPGFLLAQEQLSLAFVVAGSHLLLDLPLVIAALGLRTARARTLSQFVLLWASAVGFILSWSTFYQTGGFPDAVTLTFARASGKQVAEHALHQSPSAMLLVGSALLVVAPLLAALSSKLARRLSLSKPSRRVLALLFSLSLLFSLGGALGPGSSEALVQDASSGSNALARDVYSYQRRYFAGCASSLLAQLPSARVKEAKVAPDIGVEFARPPQVSMADYVASVESARQKKMNVVFVLIESLRADELQALGSRLNVVPHVNALARESVVFSHAYTQASHSDAADPCPLSSQGPVRGPYGGVSYPKAPPYPRVLIYDLLHALGYRTALVSSQNETWGNMLNFLDTGGLDLILHSETFDGPTYVPEADTSLRAFVAGTKKAGKLDDRHTISEAIKFVESVPSEQPFFTYLNLQNSHFPYERPGDFPAVFATPDDRITGTLSVLPLDEVASARRLYRDALHYVDAQLGRFVQHLKDSRRWEDTIFILSGDTGQAFMEHGFATHAQDLYNEVMHVPLVVRAPGLPPGKNHRLAQHIDVPPTILALLGLPAHPSFHGTDLFATEQTPRPVFLSVRTLRWQAGVVWDKYKLIVDFKRKRSLLYDLEADPLEKQDISAKLPGVAVRLEALVRAHQKATLSYYGDAQRMNLEYAPHLVPASFSLAETQ